MVHQLTVLPWPNTPSNWHDRSREEGVWKYIQYHVHAGYHLQIGPANLTCTYLNMDTDGTVDGTVDKSQQFCKYFPQGQSLANGVSRGRSSDMHACSNLLSQQNTLRTRCQ